MGTAGWDAHLAPGFLVRRYSVRLAGRVALCLLAMLSLAGCRSVPTPAPRPLDQLIRETLEFAESQQGQARNQPAALGSRHTASAPAAVRLASFIDEGPQEAAEEELPPLPGEPGPSESRRGAAAANAEDLDATKLGGPAVNEIFEETDLRQAIQSLATQAKVSVIVDEQVGGVATALIEEEPFEAALQKILLPLGLLWAEHDGQYYVGTSDPASPLFGYLSQTIDYRPQFYAPEELTALLPETMKQYVRVVGKRNLMIIDAPRRMGKQIVSELSRADQPVPQVSLEAIVAVFSPESSYQYGVNLKQLAARHAVQMDLSSLALTGIVSPAGAGQLFGKFAHTSYFLRLLEQEGYVNIRAAPHVVAKDGEKAKISIERETFFATQPVNPEFFFRQEIQRVQAGISLDITPTIRGDNITIKIERAEVSEDIRESGTDPELASPYPLINRRVIETTVNVKDGATIVIGGLTQNQTVDRENRVPFFSKIPLVGHFFRQVDKQQQEAEIAIFISPRIVYPGHTEAPARIDPPSKLLISP